MTLRLCSALLLAVVLAGCGNDETSVKTCDEKWNDAVNQDTTGYVEFAPPAFHRQFLAHCEDGTLNEWLNS